jgi:hypothetical protein
MVVAIFRAVRILTARALGACGRHRSGRMKAEGEDEEAGEGGNAASRHGDTLGSRRRRVTHDLRPKSAPSSMKTTFS